VQTLERVIWLAVAGAVGTLARFGVSNLVNRVHPGPFPYGTLVVNLAGCFLFGLVATLAEERLVPSGAARLVLLVGFMGAFTTFSTYAFETGALLRDTGWAVAAANVLAHNLLGLIALFGGVALGRAIT
jgi:CrcB protein